ncbi:hypothetical protein F4779DRAFT_624142 [Xylariaceae sp. FL0662B]|nr:hypothetical protein F4779DRAFT_624142 [Xylariaceae sp. FL0662B]
MASSGLLFTEDPPSDNIGLTNVSSDVLYTAERVLLPTKARCYFEAELHRSLKLGHRVLEVQASADGVSIDGEHFDFAVDATWGHLGKPNTQAPLPLDFPAITLVDGPLCSVYPIETPGRFTLSSVPHTPLGQFSTAAEARAVRDGVGAGTIEAEPNLIKAQISSTTTEMPGPGASLLTQMIEAERKKENEMKELEKQQGSTSQSTAVPENKKSEQEENKKASASQTYKYPELDWKPGPDGYHGRYAEMGWCTAPKDCRGEDKK